MCSPVVFVASIGDEYSFSLVRKVVPNVFVSFCLLFPSCILLNFLHSKLKRPVIENANMFTFVYSTPAIETIILLTKHNKIHIQPHTFCLYLHIKSNQ